jgi:hypothetical protein
MSGQGGHPGCTPDSAAVARSWVCALLARYQAEGEAAFGPRSRRPRTSPTAISDHAADLIIRLRKDLAGQAGAGARCCEPAMGRTATSFAQRHLRLLSGPGGRWLRSGHVLAGWLG